MTIAELHGKLVPQSANWCHDRMEDLLTSDVFGTMKYTGWQPGFLDWLRSAISPDGTMRASQVLPKDEDIRRVHFQFWPRLANGREPDVLVGIEQMDKHLLVIMIEAKYLSGASDLFVEDYEITMHRSGDQIADQVNNFPERYPGIKDMLVTTRMHLYVTAHSSCPTDVYDNSRPHIRRKDIPLFWVNWQSLPAFLTRALQTLENETAQALLSDLLQLMTRKELVPFQGFDRKPARDFAQFIGCSLWPQSTSVWWSTMAVPLPKPQHFFEGDI